MQVALPTQGISQQLIKVLQEEVSPSFPVDGKVTKTVQQGSTKSRHFWDYLETEMTALYNRGFSLA